MAQCLSADDMSYLVNEWEIVLNLWIQHVIDIAEIRMRGLNIILSNTNITRPRASHHELTAAANSNSN